MKKGVLLSTTEHVLAALYSCGVDNVYIELDALELPILDGSSQPFIEMLGQAGIRRLRKRRRYLKVVKPLEVSEGGRRIGIYPADDFRVPVLRGIRASGRGGSGNRVVRGTRIVQPDAGARENVWLRAGLRRVAPNGADSRRLARQRHRPQ